MKLRTDSVRVKSGRRRFRKIVNKTVQTIISCSFEVLSDMNGSPVTLIVKLLVASQRHEPYTLSLRIRKATTIRVVHRPDDLVYFYRIQWSTGRVRYSLKVCKLSVTSELLKLASHFKIKHVI